MSAFSVYSNSTALCAIQLLGFHMGGKSSQILFLFDKGDLFLTNPYEITNYSNDMNETGIIFKSSTNVFNYKHK